MFTHCEEAAAVEMSGSDLIWSMTHSTWHTSQTNSWLKKY